ncbi:hypothetical protein [Actinospica robiniae]|uniref:hypothetical protein n=1 Tax=Actinospica robiniae TaxID=304901 RepID=UPI001FE01E5B|nr:hypothetical protein [Actinospica robiniae]
MTTVITRNPAAAAPADDGAVASADAVLREGDGDAGVDADGAVLADAEGDSASVGEAARVTVGELSAASRAPCGLEVVSQTAADSATTSATAE